MLTEQVIILEYTFAAVDLMAEMGYDPQFGARPVKREIQRHLLNVLSKRLLADEVNRELPICVDAREGELLIRN